MAKTDLVAIKYAIERDTTTGGAKPHTELADLALNYGRPPGINFGRWLEMVNGFGRIHDRIDNLGTGATTGTAATLVPADFATAAAALGSVSVEILTEDEFATFWDTRFAHDAEIEHLDGPVLSAIEARVALEASGVAPPPSAAIQAARSDAMDPASDKHGIRQNRRKTFALAKAELAISVKRPAAPKAAR